MQDLIQLEPPLTEDAIMRTLQARFNNEKYYVRLRESSCDLTFVNDLELVFQTNVGPIVLSMNPYTDVGNPLTLASTKDAPQSPELSKVTRINSIPFLA